MKYYFKLQFKRILRLIEDAGFNPRLIIGLAIVSFLAMSYLLFQELDYARFIYPLMPLGFLSSLRNRERNEFIKNAYSKKRFLEIRAMENVLVSIPFAIFLVYQQEFIVSVMLLLTSILLSFFNNFSNSKIVIPTPFSKYPFEFIVGFRKTYLGFILSFFLLGVGLQVDNFNLAAFSVLIPFLISMSFYSKPEPKFHVWIHSKSVGEFLKHKIRFGIRNSILLSLPQILILLMFYPDRILIISIAILVGLSFVLISLLGKYSNYPSEVNVTQGFAIMFTVFFPPLALLLIPYFYSKSKQNLQNILR